ncbi:S8 family serine peptidase [bacterium]|nr:S8 family serine peptidase [bacterium]
MVRLFLKIIVITLVIGIFFFFASMTTKTATVTAKPRYARVTQLLEEAKKNSTEKIPETSKILKTAKKTKTRVLSFTEKLTEEQIKEIESKYGVKFLSKKSRHGRYVVTPDNERKLEDLKKDMNVEGISNNDTYTTTAQEIGWGVNKINAPAAWSYLLPTTGASVVVAVIDTGVQLNHPDLVDAIQSGGYDYVDDDAVPEDDNGHGTHVAGIIAATNNSIGVVGVAPGAKILPMRVCSTNGGTTSCSSIAIADAIQDSISAGVDIINLSLGGSANELIQSAINDATEAGIIVVAAAGNGNSGGCLYPAAYENVVCVGAVTEEDARAPFSNYGIGLDVVAPGVEIESLGLSSTYTTLSGTSMATAYYSGAATLVKSMLKNICTSEPSSSFCSDLRGTTQVLLNDTSIRDIGLPGTDSQFGKGAIDVSQLFSEVTQNHTSPTTLITKGASYNQPITVTNNNSYGISLSSCTVLSDNLNRTQTVPAFTISTLTQGGSSYSPPIRTGLYAKFNFTTPVLLAPGATMVFNYTYSLSSETSPNDNINYDFVCDFDRTDTGIVENYRSKSVIRTTKVDLPTTLKNVYITFGKLRYNRLVSNGTLRAGDTMYLKNYDPKKLKLLQVFLYDFNKHGNQGFKTSRITTYSRFVRTSYNLVSGRQYAYVAKFQDRATGIIVTKYFVFRVR